MGIARFFFILNSNSLRLNIVLPCFILGKMFYSKYLIAPDDFIFLISRKFHCDIESVNKKLSTKSAKQIDYFRNYIWHNHNRHRFCCHLCFDSFSNGKQQAQNERFVSFKFSKKNYRNIQREFMSLVFQKRKQSRLSSYRSLLNRLHE